MYDITIEEHFYKLTSIIRSISGLWCMMLLLRSTFTGWEAQLGVHAVYSV